MSFQGLISGSECAAPANPLSQVLKHTETDRSLQQDRLSGPSSSRLHQLPVNSSSAAGASEQDRALARQFFDANLNRDHAFAMPHHLELARISEINAHQGINEPWALEQQHQMRAYEKSSKAAWAAEFGSPPQIHSPPPPVQQGMPGRPEFQQQPSYMSSVGSYAGPMPMGVYSMTPPTLQYGSNPNFSILNQGKGKGREADFEAAFAQVAASLSPIEVQTSRVEEVDDGIADIADTLKNVSFKSEVEEDETDFSRVWDQLQSSNMPPPKEDIAKWEAQFSKLMNAERDELEDYGTNMQKLWEDGLGDYGDVKPMLFDAEGIPLLGAYIFEKNNKYMDSSSSISLLSDAKALLNNNGSLSEAALMLEAAIQQEDLGEGGYESWVLLGETRNMDEREEAGMRALLHGVKIAEESGAPGAGMLSLAISFTNESYDRASHTMLLRWFRAHYPTIPVPEETTKAMATSSSWDMHDRITDLFLNLARTQYSKDQMDPDLQIALGILFYTNGNYNQAQDCFVAALNVRPKDYLLWNRLGSSLSNGNKPEEALGAYREALQLRPTYTRAIYNVGVACLNIGADKEAAEHFLSALSLQDTTNGDSSNQLWYTLRRALLAMNRSDLADLADPEAKSSLDIFRREGFDF